MLGIYLHIPFCKKRCGYCDFVSSEYPMNVRERYVSVLIKSIEAFNDDGVPADTIYFGGGTPSLLSAEEIGRIIDSLSKKFTLSKDSEITLEANPGTVTEKKLKGYLSAGVNRLSIGIQSCKDNELYILGRLHNASEGIEAIETAHRCGFENVSADVMLGIPKQTPDTLLETVNMIADTGVKHVSAYMLKIEPETCFDCDEIRSILPTDDAVSDMYLSAVKALGKRGLEQYEISNFAVPGYESRHNLKYWTGESYIGFGASAHSYYKGRRFYVQNNITGFIGSPCSPVISEDDSPDILEEYIMLGLRLCKGISLDRVSRLGGDRDAVLRASEKFIRAGFMKKSGDNLSLTAEGFLVSNGIIAELLI